MNIFLTGVNRGLGFEIAKSAIDKGHTVIGAVRQFADKKLVRALDENRIILYEGDITNELFIKQVADDLQEKQICIDILINNAAVLVGREQTIEQLSMEDFKHTLDVNLVAPIQITKHFLKLMPENSGVIINISSEAGSITNAYGGDFSYAISKAALNMFTKQMKALTNEHNYTVYAIHPGWMKTDMGGGLAPLQPSESARAILSIALGDKKSLTIRFLLIMKVLR
ncbi:SDR family NAD(P)-dependent oxidoreductase [Bacillus sp. JCM 19034]|uniref:SDR family NAD(P)-dependent oxidoreductase n=1 Tax=Bacillus sp. JCM 19034 TaxID=1481928 RepID=UPI000782BD0B|nr:SDR family NAD(P)-dependent oxidoreductase [Bacillus sp. JCM 19034]